MENCSRAEYCFYIIRGFLLGCLLENSNLRGVMIEEGSPLIEHEPEGACRRRLFLE